MKKFIIAVLVIVVSVVVVNKANAELTERNIRAVERSIAVQNLAEGRAPMQVECERAGNMVFRVDAETGVTRCSGIAGELTAKLGNMLQEEVHAMAVMNEACARNGGIMIVEKAIYEDSTTVLTCTQSRFESYWTSK